MTARKAEATQEEPAVLRLRECQQAGCSVYLSEKSGIR
jgi:hypothetical protein